jgi:hypothetical protein
LETNNHHEVGNLGDENTSYFQAMATNNHRKNFMTSLTITRGDVVTDHDLKANVLWEAYKNRLGFDFSGISYNLEGPLQSHNVEHLDKNFSTEEILVVIKNLPKSHAPGPNGFSGLFIKSVSKSSKLISSDYLMTSSTPLWISASSIPLTLLLFLKIRIQFL